ncbi:hypothetical protein AAC387_Pa01g2011 [Persea americana]
MRTISHHPPLNENHPSAEPISDLTQTPLLPHLPPSLLSISLTPPLLHLPSLVHAHVRLLPPPPDTCSSPGPRTEPLSLSLCDRLIDKAEIFMIFYGVVL